MHKILIRSVHHWQKWKNNSYRVRDAKVVGMQSSGLQGLPDWHHRILWNAKCFSNYCQI